MHTYFPAPYRDHAGGADFVPQKERVLEYNTLKTLELQKQVEFLTTIEGENIITF